MVIDAIVSGGQTGADRAALEFALAAAIEIRGWVPKNRQAEDGPIASAYRGLRECESADPQVRTRLNVRDSDGTVVFSHGDLQGGSALTADEARRLGKPLLHVDFERLGLAEAGDAVRRWLKDQQVRVVNVAGPRASEDGRIFAKTLATLSLAVFGGA
jgi:hypothetical protein